MIKPLIAELERILLAPIDDQWAVCNTIKNRIKKIADLVSHHREALDKNDLATLHKLQERVISIAPAPNAELVQQVAIKTFSAVFDLAQHYDDLSSPLVDLVQGYKADLHAVVL